MEHGHLSVHCDRGDRFTLSLLSIESHKSSEGNPGSLKKTKQASN